MTQQAEDRTKAGQDITTRGAGDLASRTQDYNWSRQKYQRSWTLSQKRKGLKLVKTTLSEELVTLLVEDRTRTGQ